jgi:hypothetical protein
MKFDVKFVNRIDQKVIVGVAKSTKAYWVKTGPHANCFKECLSRSCPEENVLDEDGEPNSRRNVPYEQEHGTCQRYPLCHTLYAEPTGFAWCRQNERA